ncbi:multimeric flavodoxin WrbA [Clostridium saccharoperbutylacetonicum]|uniref:Multimeric flavodoxin WrbA n=1 Tax=Clostridium saccharoperbutylacetonicum N1-4(HMT) TaxID=931276 RepID=M1LUX0_9CLOT|nr:flavodoxin family protein [Clostridium saccharoperbutylacetonicum]AGF56885.1 multimeric flavodoxin WrbA [Clostridium saccharoperbutylacetonicum N1-4(HMT)]NRT62356.1 multimeric flavodoxin WrbA [Clostridium saccharoperbutylacetonicum]NSB25693.1 multimeric flavodoxin WrbA [Clostridium saccharoperbutylacetonicum]NSB45060.1 multimeric flavodoxin WrbA [Clostridium saccharoperbutylacetonicum]
MKIIAINGSPRKNGNTGILLNKALDGAASNGAETEMIHLYDLNYKGCKSCFACKLKNGNSYGQCAINDEISPILKKIKEVNAIIWGTPIYLGSITGEIKSFMERLIFPYLTYDENYSSLFGKRISVGLIYTFGVNEQRLEQTRWKEFLENNEFLLGRYFGKTESIFVTDTYQFDDYSKYVSAAFNASEKLKRRKEVFPEDCKKAFELGKRLVRIR